MRLLVTLLAVALSTCAVAAACAPAAPKNPVAPAPAASQSASASPIASDKAVCARVCAIQTRCGGDDATCRARCLPIARTLAGDVLEALVSCVESKASPQCEPGDEGASKRRKLIAACTIEATQTKLEASRANIDLFAAAICERTQQCGVEGVFSKSECLGKTKGSILSTEGEGSGAIYGALRPSKVDELVKCLKDAPCEKRKTGGDEELERCLDDVLSTAAEPTP